MIRVQPFPQSYDRGPWRGIERLAEVTDLRIAFVSSTRAGLDPLAGMTHAFDVAERLGADLIVQLGDAMPGYADDAGLESQWAELDAILAAVSTPWIRVAGNHDISDARAREVWEARVGAAAYALRVGEVLFLVLDAQDGATLDADGYLQSTIDALPAGARARLEPWLSSGLDAEGIRRLLREAPEDGEVLLAALSSAKAARGGDAVFSDEQTAWAEGILDEHRDAAWTFVLMHQPGWVGAGAPGFGRILEALGQRPATVFSGHVIHAHTEHRGQLALAALGYTDPAVAGTRFGRRERRDLLTWARMTREGAVLTNILLDEILDLDQQRVFTTAQWPDPEQSV